MCFLFRVVRVKLTNFFLRFHNMHFVFIHRNKRKQKKTNKNRGSECDVKVI